MHAAVHILPNPIMNKRTGHHDGRGAGWVGGGGTIGARGKGTLGQHSRQPYQVVQGTVWIYKPSLAFSAGKHQAPAVLPTFHGMRRHVDGQGS